jgi:hypothetical protein
MKLGRLRKKGRGRLLDHVQDVFWVDYGTGETPVSSHSSVEEERPPPPRNVCIAYPHVVMQYSENISCIPRDLRA